jgi:hypothetical protein
MALFLSASADASASRGFRAAKVNPNDTDRLKNTSHDLIWKGKVCG